jgi:hypothetical protein
MAEEATRRSDQLKPSHSSERIVILDEEIDRTRKDASETIREIDAAIEELKSRASGYVKAEVWDKISRALVITGKAAEKTADIGKRQSLRVNDSLRKLDKKTALYGVGGILAAGALVSIMVGRRRKPEKVTSFLPEEREFDTERTEEILEKARRQSVQAGREHVIVTPAEHDREEAVFGQPVSDSPGPDAERLFQESDTESPFAGER